MGGDEMIGERTVGENDDVVPQEGLRVTLLGSGAVASGGEPLKFATRHAELILYLLVLAGGEGLPRDELIVALWPGVDATSGRPRLRTALWQIRRALGAHAWRLERERGVVRLTLEGVIVDIGPQPPVLGSTILVGWKFQVPPTLNERVA